MKNLNYLFCILFILSLFSCRKDFVVDDIKNKSVVVNAPANGFVTTSNLVTFWWEKLDGAEKYSLQVVQPNFTTVSKLVLDTSVAGTKYTITLQPGNYQWRIKATNAGGSTEYQTYSLVVDTTSNLSGQLVYPISPASGSVVGNTAITFSWNTLSSATYYQLQINDGSILTATTSGTSYNYTVPAVTNSNTPFTWRVKAFNDFSVTQYNTASTFTVDLLAPSAPVLSNPVHGATVKDTVSLRWTRIGAPDAISDSIFVSSDSLFTNVFSKTSTTLQSIKINLLNNPPNTNNSIYWWKLKSVDQVGNRSVYSSQLKFKLSTP
jgi:hypothetical protein